MTAIWELIICAGVSGWGCGYITVEKYPSEDACYKALNSMIIGKGAQVVESESRRDVVAHCRPEQKK